MMRVFSPLPSLQVAVQFGLSRDIRNDKLVQSSGIEYDGISEMLSAQDGIAVEVGHNDIYSHYVILKHSDDLYTFYGNGQEAPTNFVEGELVEVAQLIFKADSPYFEVRKSQNGDQIDPNILFHPYAKHPGVLDPDQADLVVDGVLGKKTWAAWQMALKSNRTWNYPGIIDGIPNDQTWKAIKESLILFYDETAITPEEETIITAVQHKLNGLGFYHGEYDGKFNEEMVAALQRSLNAAKYK